MSAACIHRGPWCRPGPSTRRPRSLVACRASVSSSRVSQQTPCAEPVQRLERLPVLTYSYEKHAVDARELADLLQQVACPAPGHALNSRRLTVAAGSSSSSSSSSSASSSVLAEAGGSIDPDRLAGALQRSLLCVAAYTDEAHLPARQHLGARRLLLPEAQAAYDQEVAAAAAAAAATAGQQGRQRAAAGARGRWAPFPYLYRPRRVLVGFVRAVGDAALVATVHDVAVMPELQGLGLGRQLLDRLLRQLDRRGIVDVGLLAPPSSQGFFAACSFGRDSEGSTTMTLAPGGMQPRVGQPLAGMSCHLKAPRQAR